MLALRSQRWLSIALGSVIVLHALPKVGMIHLSHLKAALAFLADNEVTLNIRRKIKGFVETKLPVLRHGELKTKS